MKNITLFISLLFCISGITAQNRWKILDKEESGYAAGGIMWTVGNNDIHTDHIEMSGKHISVILTYGTDPNGLLVSKKLLVFPMLRTIPNDTHASLMHTFADDARPVIKINKRVIQEKASSFYLKGIWESTSDIGFNSVLRRELTPSVDKPHAVEKFTITNNGKDAITVDIEDMQKTSRTHQENGVYGAYEIKAETHNSGVFKVQSGKSVSFSVVYSGRRTSSAAFTNIDIDKEIAQRKEFTDLIFKNIQFNCPDKTLNKMFDFAKIRSMESIYETKAGLVHGPGGSRYYAAIWANDQAEYANPFFAYTGYDTAIESVLTSWKWFAKYMNPQYKPIPSSIIAEGDSYWNGAGDRGDQAMIAYGAARSALALGDREKAKEVWPLIEWCLEYCKRKINKNGVVASDSDELENRFPSGDANLCTSSLYYDALVSACYLGRDLGIPQKQLKEYKTLAEQLHKNINSFFGADVQGFDTYRYYEGNDILRSWICIPLTVDIFERANGTVDALFSPLLWTKDGLLTITGDKTFWDRSTLYGLRGAFAAGAKERALPYLTDYSKRRLLGDHVPYAVEAWPEGNQRHLSAESALYCRVVTEGIFGFRPTGLNSFSITPQLPNDWEYMQLKNIIAFDKKSIDIDVNKVQDRIKTDIYINGKLVKSIKGKSGQKIDIEL
ncbi:hypothetical protein [Prevotella sp. 10(H)]|uniref:hypothetical protein n=1 Tax=Prevotella sp. 10(H) TaxID=1158294 RepID=UPI0004A6B4F5|nr:hypothetical protein [Prevotella sp. 10(H)]